MYLGLDKHATVDADRLKKSALAQQVGRFLQRGESRPDKERAPVLSLARMLARDIEQNVRAVLAFELRSCASVPKDLAEKIAKDIEDVAVPFLSETRVFDDQEMSELVMVLAEYAKTAVARRPTVGPKTSSAIAVSGADQSVGYLLRNSGAQIPRQAFDKISRRFDRGAKVLDILAERPNVPVAVVERLVDLVSDEGRKVIADRYALEPRLMAPLNNRVRMDQLFERLAKVSSDQVRAYVTDLKAQKKFSVALIEEALKRRDLRSFEIAIAVASGDVLATARDVIRYGGRVGRLRMLKRAGFDRADMPRIARDVDEAYRINKGL